MTKNLTIVDLTQAMERIQGLKEIHLSEPLNRDRIFDRYREVSKLLIDIRQRHESLTPSQRQTIQNAVGEIRAMERAIEETTSGGTEFNVTGFNRTLSRIQSTLDEAAGELQQST